MKVISVVRDFHIYERLFVNNKYKGCADLYPIDNTIENKHISIRYNEFLDNYNYEDSDWLVFCHEDWEIKEDLEKRLENLDRNCLWGPIGVRLDGVLGLRKVFCGQIIDSNRDGGSIRNVGCRAEDGEDVCTFNCQCLMVHSDLIKNYHLRFDENLSYDWYVEDFSINAKEKHAILSKVLQLNCQHYSLGQVSERFFKQLDYLRNKYKNAKHSYQNTCCQITIGKWTMIPVVVIRDENTTEFYWLSWLKGRVKLGLQKIFCK